MANLLPEKGVFAEERFAAGIFYAIPRQICAAKATIAHVDVSQKFQAFVANNPKAQGDVDTVLKLLNDDGKGLGALRNTAVGYRLFNSARIFQKMSELPADLLNVNIDEPVDMPARFNEDFVNGQINLEKRPKPKGNIILDLIRDLIHLRVVIAGIRTYVEHALEANAQTIYSPQTKAKYDALKGELMKLFDDAVKKIGQAAKIIERYTNPVDIPVINAVAIVAEKKKVLIPKTFERNLVLIPFYKDGKFGFSDENKNLIIPAQYASAQPFCEGLARVRLKSNGKCGFIDTNGNQVIQAKYDFAEDFSEGLAEVQINNKKIFVDYTGREIILPKYDFVYKFIEGLASVRLDNKEGFIDKAGKEVIRIKYDSVCSFSEGLARVRLKDKWGFIDKTGKEVIPLKYEFVGDFSEGLAFTKSNSRWGSIFGSSNKCSFITKAGEEIFIVKCEQAEPFSEGLSLLKIQHGDYSFIDKTGKEIIPLKSYHVNSFSEGLAVVLVIDHIWSFIDKAGKRIISNLTYGKVNSFSEGLARVSFGGKDGFIDKTGNEIIKLRNAAIRDFSNGLALVTTSIFEMGYYIDTKGTEYCEL